MTIPIIMPVNYQDSNFTPRNIETTFTKNESAEKLVYNQTDKFTVNSENKQQYKKPGILTIIGGIIAGNTVANIIQKPKSIIRKSVIQKIESINNLTEGEFTKVTQGVNTTLKNTGLSDKGVQILRVTNKNVKEILPIIKENIKFMPKKIKEFFAKIIHSSIADGKNAAYLPHSNKIIVPEKKLVMAAFHEMGHAANAHFSKIGKCLQQSRKLTLLALPISLIAIYKTKKAPNQDSKGFLDKTTDFIKTHAGALTFLSFAPVLIEEAMASIKGGNFAKKVLDPELAQKVIKTNKIAYLSYLSAALLASAGVTLGVKVKDAIAKPEPIPQ